jgi:hypothetical protein
MNTSLVLASTIAVDTPPHPAVECTEIICTTIFFCFAAYLIFRFLRG